MAGTFHSGEYVSLQNMPKTNPCLDKEKAAKLSKEFEASYLALQQFVGSHKYYQVPTEPPSYKGVEKLVQKQAVAHNKAALKLSVAKANKGGKSLVFGNYINGHSISHVWLDEWPPKVVKKVTFLDIETTAEPTQTGLEKLREKRRKAASKDQMKLPFKSKILWQTI